MLRRSPGIPSPRCRPRRLSRMPPGWLFVYLSVCLSVSLSVFLGACHSFLSLLHVGLFCLALPLDLHAICPSVCGPIIHSVCLACRSVLPGLLSSGSRGNLGNFSVRGNFPRMLRRSSGDVFRIERGDQDFLFALFIYSLFLLLLLEGSGICNYILF